MHLEAAHVAELVGAADEHDGDAELVARRARRRRRSRPGPGRRPSRRPRSGRLGWRRPIVRSVDVDGLAAVVPAAVAAHDVGRLVLPQRGQRLRAGVSSRHAEARRLLLFDLEVFFFGTAIAELRG